MKQKLVIAILAFACGVGAAFAAAAPKTYQVTGPVLALTPDVITVQKDTDKWEIGREALTKVTGAVKVGSTVTVIYRMNAVSIELKPPAK